MIVAIIILLRVVSPLAGFSGWLIFANVIYLVLSFFPALCTDATLILALKIFSDKWTSLHLSKKYASVSFGNFYWLSKTAQGRLLPLYEM